MTNNTINHDKVISFINRQKFAPDSQWSSLLHCLHSQQFNENLSRQQRSAITDLLAGSLKLKSCSEIILQDIAEKKEGILNAPYVSELQAALEETASLLDQFKSISQRRVGDLVNLEKNTLNTVKSGKDPSTMVAELRKAFKAVIKVMQEDSKVLEKLSNTDQLTGLANRRSFDEYLEHAIASSTREEPLSLLMFDIDNFKDFNDNFGHLVGDEVLKIVAKIMKESVSDSNIRGHKHYLSARYGGEELGIIMPQCTENQCLQLAESIRKRIEHYPIVIRNSKGDILKKDIHITVSAGFSQMHYLWLNEQKPAEQIIAATDKALYAAKKRGKNMVCQCKAYLDHNKKMTFAIL